MTVFIWSGHLQTCYGHSVGNGFGETLIQPFVEATDLQTSTYITIQKHQGHRNTELQICFYREFNVLLLHQPSVTSTPCIRATVNAQL